MISVSAEVSSGTAFQG